MNSGFTFQPFGPTFTLYIRAAVFLELENQVTINSIQATPKERLPRAVGTDSTPKGILLSVVIPTVTVYDKHRCMLVLPSNVEEGVARIRDSYILTRF